MITTKQYVINNSPEHEAKCLRCGRCCYAAVIVNGEHIIVEGLHCKFLDAEKGTCPVYTRRFGEAPWCQPASIAAEKGALWDGCPYCSEFPGPRKRQLDPETYKEMWPRIARSLLDMENVPLPFTWEKFFARAERREPFFRWKLVRYRGEGGNAPTARAVRTLRWWARLLSWVVPGRLAT